MEFKNPIEYRYDKGSFRYRYDHNTRTYAASQKESCGHQHEPILESFVGVKFFYCCCVIYIYIRYFGQKSMLSSSSVRWYVCVCVCCCSIRDIYRLWARTTIWYPLLWCIHLPTTILTCFSWHLSWNICSFFFKILKCYPFGTYQIWCNSIGPTTWLCRVGQRWRRKEEKVWNALWIG